MDDKFFPPSPPSVDKAIVSFCFLSSRDITVVVMVVVVGDSCVRIPGIRKVTFRGTELKKTEHSCNLLKLQYYSVKTIKKQRQEEVVVKQRLP